MKVSNQFVSSAGVFFAMASLSARGFHASCTFGNAPFVDIIISTENGKETLAAQVKTAKFAQRWKGRKEKHLVEYQWFLGHNPNDPATEKIMYLFVDLRLRTWEPAFDAKAAQFLPEIFIVPGAKVREYYIKNCQKGRMSRFHPSRDFIEVYKENFAIIDEQLSKTAQ